MGYMQGFPKGETLYVQDAFALPVEGTETRVNAGDEANLYTINYTEAGQRVHRYENVVGWYHSHPGYGCWLSGIDVSTQKSMQMIQDPCVAIVVDPFRTMSSGKVELGCFRTYKDDYAEEQKASVSLKGGAAMPGDKFDEFGLHAHKYYKVEHSFYKSSMNTELLERIWLEYWQHTLSSSPLLSNQDQITKTLVNMVTKIKQLPQSDKGKLIQKDTYDPIVNVSNQLACECNHGLMLEVLKKFTFACNSSESF